ncbi:site-specific DNA-methyltransferase [Micromonospora haikouensis]|uniref:site-specific DNA-methyltransferase n=1 Tax=Micromonospora haikouensis TaxID=686309 RepID=UPI000696EE5D|nr:site-specific DNA-methyltransferase [Micromonospora haikouensis]
MTGNEAQRSSPGIRSITIGDNLEALARLDSGSAGLVYMDPPFNSGRIYQTRVSKASTTSDAFADIWSWSDASTELLASLGEHLNPGGASMTRALLGQLGRTPLAAYLVGLAARLGQVHRLLSEQGSLYVHVDPAASHYLKIILDAVFGPQNFRNEIVWRRTHAHSGSRRYGPIHDTILFYSKTSNYTWNQQYSPYTPEYIETYFRQSDERGRYQAITCTGPGERLGTLAHYEWKGQYPPAGRHWAWVKPEMERLEAEGRLVYSRNGVPRLKRYVEDSPGVRLQDIWSDVAPLSAHSAERTGYDTQKPLALLERIVASSSRPGDLVLDPYGGTGTTALAAERLGRQWRVMDMSMLAGTLTLARIRAEAPQIDVAVSGLPADTAAARRLLREDPLGYGSWATALLATVLDRSTHGPSLAVGTRPWGQRTIGLVPLDSVVDAPGLLHTGRFTSGFVVDGPGCLELVRALTEAGTPHVQKVSLSSLVGANVAVTGRADIDLRLGA